MGNASGNAIELENILLQRGGKTLLDRIDWQAPRGGCCAILGPNGAGKSTILALVSGYLWPQKGSVRVLGELYGQVDLTHFRRRIGVLGQSRIPEFHGDQSALETVLAGLWGGHVVPLNERPTADDVASALKALRTTGMAERVDDPFGALSTGEQMRVLLARALVARHELLILDEPAAALDMAARAAFVRALDAHIEARPDLTVVLVTHNVEDLPTHTREVLLLSGGRIVAAGPIGQTLTSVNLSRTFGCPVQLHQADGHFWTHVTPSVDWQFNGATPHKP